MNTATTDAHLSPYELDSLRLGRLAAERTLRARDHLGRCVACRRLEDSLLAEQKRFATEVFPRGKPALRTRAEELSRRAAWRRWVLLGLAPLAPAAIALVLVARPDRAPLLPYQGEKGGGTAFQLVVRRAGRVLPAAEASPLHAGEAIRFVVTARRPYVMIASVDGQGHSKVYVPYEGSESSAVPVGRRLDLPEGGSIELDAASGPERIFALFSRRPLAAPAVLSALDQLGARGASAIRGAERLPIAADEQASELIEKAER